MFCECKKPKIKTIRILRTSFQVCSKSLGGCGCEYNEVLEELPPKLPKKTVINRTSIQTSLNVHGFWVGSVNSYKVNIKENHRNYYYCTIDTPKEYYSRFYSNISDVFDFIEEII